MSMPAIDLPQTDAFSAHWSALGTGVTVQVTDPAALVQASAIVSDELAAIDLACSRFRGDSELERVNAGAPNAVPAGALLLEAVEVALRAARSTDGDVDPALGEALRIAGYDRDFGLLEQPTSGLALMAMSDQPASELAPRAAPMHIRAHRVAGWRTIELDRARGTIRVGRGVRLDLGATAKALAADRSARAASAKTGVGVLVNLGGDISLAGPPPAGGWRVFVTDDHRNRLDAPGQMVSLFSGGLATSSVTCRRWLHEGRLNHHIIDPHTGAPLEHSCWRTVSVAATTCVDANVASTAALVRGARATAGLFTAGPPARLVSVDGTVCTVGDWPIEAERRP